MKPTVILLMVVTLTGCGAFKTRNLFCVGVCLSTSAEKAGGELPEKPAPEEEPKAD